MTIKELQILLKNYTKNNTVIRGFPVEHITVEIDEIIGMIAFITNPNIQEDNPNKHLLKSLQLSEIMPQHITTVVKDETELEQVLLGKIIAEWKFDDELG